MRDNARLLLRTYVSDILQEEYESAGVSLTPDSFDAIRAAILVAVHNGISDAAADYNAQSSILRSLPTEVLICCFGQLDMRHRVRITSVSRRWREVALSALSLWTRFDTKILNREDISMLCEFLLRSGSAPLDLRVECAPRYAVQLSQLLRDHIHHIRTISVTGFGSLLLGDVTAPVLEGVECSGGLVPPQAPLLRYIAADWLEVNDDVQFQYPNLISFCGDVRGSRADAFFNIFPNLERLTLNRRGDSSVTAHWPRGLAPVSLTHLRLMNYEQDDAYLETFHGCRLLHVVQFEGYSLASVLTLLANIEQPLHRLDLSSAKAILETEQAPEATMSVTSRHHSLSLAGVPVDAFLALRELSITLLEDSSCIPTPLALPTLERLTLRLGPNQLRSLSCADGALLNTPALRTLVLYRLRDNYYYSQSPELQFAHLVVRHISSLLRRLGILRVHKVVISGEPVNCDVLGFCHDGINLSLLQEFAVEVYHDLERQGADLRDGVKPDATSLGESQPVHLYSVRE